MTLPAKPSISRCVMASVGRMVTARQQRLPLPREQQRGEQQPPRRGAEKPQRHRDRQAEVGIDHAPARRVTMTNGTPVGLLPGLPIAGPSRQVIEQRIGHARQQECLVAPGAAASSQSRTRSSGSGAASAHRSMYPVTDSGPPAETHRLPRTPAPRGRTSGRGCSPPSCCAAAAGSAGFRQQPGSRRRPAPRLAAFRPAISSRISPCSMRIICVGPSLMPVACSKAGNSPFSSRAEMCLGVAATNALRRRHRPPSPCAARPPRPARAMRRSGDAAPASWW